MKYALLIVVFFTTSSINAQTIVLKNIYSPELKDSIYYRVWLPENFDKNAKHTAIYTVEDTEDGILFGCASFAIKQKDIPNAIVIGIIKGRMYIDFNFVTGKPNPKGDIFLKEFTTQIIPDVEKEFGASPYKAFMGHSYSAVYGNYLMLYQPQLFKGYILFAPERFWDDETKPVYNITDAVKDFYAHHKTFVYLAVGQDDIDRRKKYVQEITQKIKRLDSSTFIFKSEIVPGAHHSSIVPQKMEAALRHIFSQAYSFQTMDSVDNVQQYFNKIQTNINNVFGVDIPKDAQTSWFFYKLAAKNRDQAAFASLMNYFPFQDVPGGAGLDFCNIASVCLQEGWTEKAGELYKKGIERSIEDEKNKHALQNAYNINWAARELAFKIYSTDTYKGWNTLTDAAAVTHLIGAYVNVGRFSVEKKFKLKEGISFLEKCITMKDAEEEFTTYQERIYQYLSEAYDLTGNKRKALDFAKQTLAINSNNEKAKKIAAGNSK